MREMGPPFTATGWGTSAEATTRSARNATRAIAMAQFCIKKDKKRALVKGAEGVSTVGGRMSGQMRVRADTYRAPHAANELVRRKVNGRIE